jgi:hypothetical protein
MYYRIAVPPGSCQDKQLKLLAEMVQDQPSAKVLRDRLEQWLQSKGKQCRLQTDEIVRTLPPG